MKPSPSDLLVNYSATTAARGLGWLSIGLGMAGLLAPRRLASALGMEQQTRVLQAFGLREAITGVGLLTARDPRPWVWARIVGDALDVATLTAQLRPTNPQRGTALAALAAVGSIALGDLRCARTLGRDAARQAIPLPDYSQRSGLPREPQAMRGAASDFQTPHEFRIPDALRPYMSPTSSREH